MRVIALLVALAMVWPTVSYARALTYPGDASFLVRSVEWVRDHGGGGLVDTVENWWFAQGPTGPPDPASVPAPAPAPAGALSGASPLPGEGAWTAAATTATGRSAVFTTFQRPDPAHPAVIAGVARIDQTVTQAQMIAGTRQPGISVAADRAQVPAQLRSVLVATFNSGFKMKDARGGAFLDGRAVVPLRDGAASLVIDSAGRVDIVAWNGGPTPGPGVIAVRQNLDLIVTGGQPVAGLDSNANGTWGSTNNQLQYTWRSGVGVDAGGDLVYVGGGNLTLATLADAMTSAGVVRGMEFDIHNQMVDMLTYQHQGGVMSSTKLLPDMPRGTDRYLVPDQRDFFAITMR